MTEHGAHDDELMRRAAAGDETAFRELVERWEQQVFGFLYHMTGSTEDALDLRQDTFVRVHREAGRYRPEGRFRPWLMRIAGNLARSHLRRRRVIGWVGFDPRRHDRAGQAPSPEKELERQEQRELVRRALAALPARQREAVVLRRYQELSQREIAAAMGVSEGAVESLLARAAATLRRMLGDAGARGEKRT